MSLNSHNLRPLSLKGHIIWDARHHSTVISWVLDLKPNSYTGHRFFEPFLYSWKSFDVFVWIKISIRIWYSILKLKSSYCLHFSLDRDRVDTPTEDSLWFTIILVAQLNSWVSNGDLGNYSFLSRKIIYFFGLIHRYLFI